MTKLSSPQNAVLLTAIQNEWRSHKREYGDPNRRTAWLQDNGIKSTYNSLVIKGMLTSSLDKLTFTDTGRTAAIDLLHEGAADEMADAFHYREMEAKRKQSAENIQETIRRRFGLFLPEVTVHADYRPNFDTGENDLRYNVEFPQVKTGRKWSSDLVEICYDRDDGYYVKTTGTSLLATDAKRMGELMLIAVQVIESGILGK